MTMMTLMKDGFISCVELLLVVTLTREEVRNDWCSHLIRVREMPGLGWVSLRRFAPQIELARLGNPGSSGLLTLNLSAISPSMARTLLLLAADKQVVDCRCLLLLLLP